VKNQNTLTQSDGVGVHWTWEPPRGTPTQDQPPTGSSQSEARSRQGRKQGSSCCFQGVKPTDVTISLDTLEARRYDCTLKLCPGGFRGATRQARRHPKTGSATGNGTEIMSPRQRPTEKAVDGRPYTVDGEAKLTDKDEAPTGSPVLYQRPSPRPEDQPARTPLERGSEQSRNVL